MVKLKGVVFITVFLLLTGTSPAWALKRPFDHGTWDRLLKRYVNEEGDVQYQALQKDPSLLDEYLDQLKAIDPREFPAQWPREEILALYLNAYHAGVLRAVAEAYPVKSIQDIPGVWDAEYVQIGKEGYSLNQLRVGALLGQFRDEKIHVVLSCGAKGCPRLRREAFTGPRVEGQLFLATREFVNNEKYVQIKPQEKKVQLSLLLKWYAEDFILDFGPIFDYEEADREWVKERAVLSFVAHYLDDPAKITFLEEGKYKVQYPPFDWRLNDWKPSQTT